MCLAVPFQIVALNGPEAVGESLGVRRKIRVDFIREPKIGEYVIVHAGFAVERLTEKQASEDLEAFFEVSEAAAREGRPPVEEGAR
jgi:hydrogenase expression/formation protein HypC